MCVVVFVPTIKRCFKSPLQFNSVALQSSTLARAKETAEIIGQQFPNIPLVYDAELEEGNPDLLPHRNRFERVYKNYFVANQGLEKETDVLVCHGNLIRFLVCRYDTQVELAIVDYTTSCNIMSPAISYNGHFD